MSTLIRILSDEPYGTVSPRLYGHFAEHLGRCCYDGLWIGDARQDIPLTHGFRTDVINALKAMPTPLLRWPGGCYADHYHWRDGIGSDRPARLGLSCGRRVLDDNGLGTHEFLKFCEMIGAEPYLAGNMGSGSVQEMADWVEYCNTDLPTKLGSERVSNGQATPWGVKLWGVGNENWGCGGNYDPESYALEYRRYSLMLQHVDPSIEMVFCGHNLDWNRRSIAKMRDHLGFMDHFSIHRYWINGGHGTEFSEAEYYALLKEAHETEEFVIETRALLEDASGGRKHVGIALDEWGVWHPEARTWGPGHVGSEVGDYSQACTLRDALATSVALEGFHRQCASLSMANLAQIVNVLHAPVMTEGDRMWCTPTYYVLQMHAVHLNATAYRTELSGGSSLPDGSAAISATATSGGVTVTNRHLSSGATVNLVAGHNWSKGVLLASDRASDENGPGNEERVRSRPLAIHREGELITFELPPHSVATIF